MYLSPTEEDRLRVFAAAELARRVLERGQRLNAPEAVALIADEMHMAARLGASWTEVRRAGMAAVSVDQVLEGVEELVAEVRVEVLLGDGRRLAVVRDPIGGAAGHGVPPMPEGRLEEAIELSPGRGRRRLTVTNTSARPVRVSSHYPFWRTNARLEFDRNAARGFRLDIPAGSSIRWAPGEAREVDLVALEREEPSGEGE